ncbi:MAG: TlpA family protein disulfide reductase [Myxococcota bacterium]
MRRLGWSLLLAALLLGACGEGRAPTGEPAPEIEVERLDGSRVRLSDLRGRWVLLDFWATWCPPCVLEIPELNRLHRRHAGDSFEILAVSLDEGPAAKLASWLEEHDVRYPVAVGDLELAERFGAYQFPFHVLIGPDGTILERLDPGFHDHEELEALLRRHRPG